MLLLLLLLPFVFYFYFPSTSLPLSLYVLMCVVFFPRMCVCAHACPNFCFDSHFGWHLVYKNRLKLYTFLYSHLASYDDAKDRTMCVCVHGSMSNGQDTYMQSITQILASFMLTVMAEALSAAAIIITTSSNAYMRACVCVCACQAGQI